LTSLQFIDEDGSKRFLPGGELKGCFMGIGSVDMNKAQDKPGNILICEGFATGASLCEWYRQPVIVAFNAGNLEPVAKVIRELYPDSTLIICGDNDPSGVGQDSARKAALACSGRYLLPPKVGIDFNDLITIWRSNRVVA
jgi:putative DNA primase/helicase